MNLGAVWPASVSECFGHDRRSEPSGYHFQQPIKKPETQTNLGFLIKAWRQRGPRALASALAMTVGHSQLPNYLDSTT